MAVQPKQVLRLLHTIRIPVCPRNNAGTRVYSMSRNGPWCADAT